jgi:hypothetical protein
MVLGCQQLVAVVLGFFYYELVLEPPNNTLHHSSFSVYKYLLSATLLFFLPICIYELCLFNAC